jgi:hypothetical protein
MKCHLPDEYQAPDVTAAMIRLKELGTNEQLQHAYMGYVRIARAGGEAEEEGISLFLEKVRKLWDLPESFDRMREQDSSLIIESRRFLLPSPPEVKGQANSSGCAWILVGPLLALVLMGHRLLAG